MTKTRKAKPQRPYIAYRLFGLPNGKTQRRIYGHGATPEAAINDALYLNGRPPAKRRAEPGRPADDQSQRTRSARVPRACRAGGPQ